MKVILSTEDLNSYGFWVLTSGIVLDRFKKNPVVTLNHDSWSTPVGKINNIRVEGTQLVGDIEFDEEDDRGIELKRKYEKGFMNGFSIGIRVLTWSEDGQYLKEGQTNATAVKSELMELAAATVPSNSNAVKLYNSDGQLINLSANSNSIPQVTQNRTKMKEIALSLGLSENATEQEINAKIAELKAQKKEEKQDSKKLAAVFIALGVSKGIVTDENKADFEELFNTKEDLAIRILNHFEKQATTELKAEVQETVTTKPKSKDESLSTLLAAFGSNAQPQKVEKTWEQLTESELIELREKPDKTEYIKLFTARFGYAPKL